MKLPDSWHKKPLGELFKKIVVGYVGNVNDHYCDASRGIPFYRTLNIRDGYFRHDEIRHVTKEFNDKNKKSQIENDDIVIARVGANLGMVCKVSGLNGMANMANAIIIKNKSAKNASSDFYTYFLLSPFGKSQIYAGAAGGAQGVFNTKLTQEISVPVPPLPEQKKIAQILSTWDKAITTTERLLANSQQQKKALMQQLLTGKKRLLDKNGVRFSGEWSSYLLEKLEELGWVMLGRGNVISKIDIENTPGDYPIYSSSVKNNGLMGKYGEYMFDEELITWSVDGGGNFFYRPKHKFSVTNVSGYMRLNAERLNYQFIAAQLELHHSKLEFDYQSKAHPSVIRKAYTLTIPSLDEQKRIAAVLSTADQEISALQQKLDALKQEKKALMQQLLTGKRRVKVH